MQKDKRTNKKYSPEFKIRVILDMINNNLGYRETSRKYAIPCNKRVAAWERIYLEKGVHEFMEERRGRKNIAGTQRSSQPQSNKTVEDQLIAENQYLRMENEYLKKLNALVQQRIDRENGKKQ